MKDYYSSISDDMAREVASYYGLLSVILIWSTTQIVSCHSINDLFSQKSAVIVGQAKQLSCVTDFPSNCNKWTFKRVGTTKEINVYSKEIGINSNFARINVTTHDSGGCILKINNVQLDDAGNYECSVFARNKTILRIVNYSLTVIDQRFDCSENFEGTVDEGQEIELTCNVSFKGDWIPKTQWKRITKQGFEEYISEDQQTIASTCRLTPTGLKASLNFKANYTLHGSTFTYRLLVVSNFAEETVHDFHEMKQTWTSSPLNVLYGVKSIQVYTNDNEIRNNAQIFCVGDKLECSADANPRPTYEWVDDRGILRVTGESLDILPNMLNLDLMCTANNSVSENRSHSFRVTEHCKYGQDYTFNWKTTVVSFLVGLSAASALFTVVIICLKKRAFQGQNETRNRGEFSNPREITPGVESQSNAPHTGSYTSIPKVDEFHRSIPRKNILDGSTNFEEYAQLNIIDASSVYTKLEVIKKVHSKDHKGKSKNKE